MSLTSFAQVYAAFGFSPAGVVQPDNGERVLFLPAREVDKHPAGRAIVARLNAGELVAVDRIEVSDGYWVREWYVGDRIAPVDPPFWVNF